MTGRCPSNDDVLAFVECALAPEAREATAAHIEGCDACRALLVTLALLRDDRPAQERYELLWTIGAGGMGVVQAGFDRELNRKVALKFLVADESSDTERARARLLREARALAQLAHPNVITVHDVGVLDDDVFVAMELVEGENLREWLASGSRTFAAKLRVLLQAGEGLGAAHAAGFVHRDFKPENVLVGRDGRVRVTDFGLARAVDGDGEAAGPETAKPLASTRTGVRAGTPAYMAPEQKLGRHADARSDVYAYCVTAWEVVAGVRPGTRRSKTARPPRWLEHVLSRGLREKPEERWPSMRRLLDAIDRGPAVTPRRVAAALVAVALVLSAAAVVRGAHPAAPPPCKPDPAAFAGVWDEPQRAAVLASFRAADPTNARTAFGVVDAALDRMRDRWLAMQTDNCVATRVRRDQSETVLDLRTGCLDTERAKAAALVRILAQADRSVVDNAGAAVADLPPVDDCGNVRALSAVEALPTDPERRAALDDGQAKLASATALHYTGKENDALALIEPALAEVRSAGYPPLEAKLLVLRADVIMELGRPRLEMEAAMQEAALRALEARDDASAAAAWILLTWQYYSRPTEGRLWARYAEAAIERIGGDDFLEADRCTRLGQIEFLDGHMDVARALLEKAKPLFERTRGLGYYRIGSILDGLGEIAVYEQRLDEAVRMHHLGRQLRERAVGRDNIATVTSMFNEQEDMVRLGKLDDAAAMLAELDARVARTGDPETAYLMLDHAALDRARGDFAAAHALDEEARRHWAAALTSDDGLHKGPLMAIGLDDLGLGRPAEAIAPLEAALDYEGWQAPARADALFALARALDDAKRDRPRALALARQASDLLEPLAARYGHDYSRKRAEMLAWLRARS